jgi:hypothetical protein
MGFQLGEIRFLVLAKVSGALNGVLAGRSWLLALMKVDWALDGVLAR